MPRAPKNPYQIRTTFRGCQPAEDSSPLTCILKRDSFHGMTTTLFVVMTSEEARIDGNSPSQRLPIFEIHQPTDAKKWHLTFHRLHDGTFGMEFEGPDQKYVCGISQESRFAWILDELDLL